MAIINANLVSAKNIFRKAFRKKKGLEKRFRKAFVRGLNFVHVTFMFIEAACTINLYLF